MILTNTEFWLLAGSLIISLLGNVIQSHMISIYKNSYQTYRRMYEELLKRKVL